MAFKNSTGQTCPECGRGAIGWAFAGYTFDYFNCLVGHVWHKDTERVVYGLDDCPWYDVDVLKRPFWAQHDCGGRMLDSALGLMCENHLNSLMYENHLNSQI